ncbi:hypothetical protein ACK280_26260 [Mycobacterium sherrisii]|uniref:hypothetical protein n=1 Tax=Mycobacterium sherrisii TaxID=243061 RepID=UPI0039752DE2
MQQPVGTVLGPIIPWLSDADAAHLTAKGLVEEIGPDHPLWEQAQSISIPGGMGAPRAIQYHGEGFDEDRAAAFPAGERSAPDDLVADCVRLLDQLRDEEGPVVPSSAGRPACADALRKAGYAFGNDVIAAAVRYRKSR